MIENKLIVYETEWILRRIYEVSDKIRHKVVDQTEFEDRCIKRISRYLTASEENKNNRRYIERLIKEVASEIVNTYQNEHAELFSDLAKQEQDSDGLVEFDPVDVLADVESEVIKKETITLLAQDDRRKILVLEAWSIGNTNNSQTSRTLARTLGGNSDSHRKFIQRFQKECRDILSAAI